MRFVIPAVAIVAATAAPVIAQEAMDFDTMTCADLLALDDAAQTDAIEELRDWVTFSAESPDPAADTDTGAASTDTTGGDTAAGSEPAAAETSAAETGADAEAAGADTAAGSEAAAADIDTDIAEVGTEAEGADTEAAEGDTGSIDPEIAATLIACEGAPDMLAKDAMAAAIEEAISDG